MATWQWRRQVGPFSRHFHVIVPDLLCFGGSSPCPSSPPPSESGQAAALAALLDALPGLANTARVAVVGTSYGGFVAYALARAAGPGRVGPVVISNSDLLKTAEDDRALLQRAGCEWASTAARRSRQLSTRWNIHPCHRYRNTIPIMAMARASTSLAFHATQSLHI